MNQPLQKSLRTKLLKNFRTNELSICESFYPTGLQQPRHTHKFASFSFVLHGNYAEKIDARTHSRQTSTLIFHPPEESHAVVFEDDVRILSVEINFEKLAEIRRHSIIFDCSASCRTEKTNFLGNRIYQEFCRMDAFSLLSIEGLILELLAEASRSKIGADDKNIPNWLLETEEFLRGNFTESVTIEEISKIADVHPVHLSRVFRRKFGCTIGEYVRRLRVELAAKQIASTEIPLSEIAQATGFADQSHLHKIFKSEFGLTPVEYRKLNRRN
jgi:AraC family transcriptional regulator